jgi:HEAT repeat protein
MPEEDEMAVTSEQVRAELVKDEPNYEAAAQLGTDALPHLQRFVESGDPNLAPKAAYLAGRIGVSQASPILELAATSDDAGIRVAAAAGVRYLPDEQADNVLLPLLDDDEPVVRKKALEAVPTTLSQDLADKVEVLQEYDSEQALRKCSTVLRVKVGRLRLEYLQWR